MIYDVYIYSYIVYINIPIDHISTLFVYVSPFINSGAAYGNDPQDKFISGDVLPNPKSISFIPMLPSIA